MCCIQPTSFMELTELYKNFPMIYGGILWRARLTLP